MGFGEEGRGRWPLAPFPKTSMQGAVGCLGFDLLLGETEAAVPLAVGLHAQVLKPIAKPPPLRRGRVWVRVWRAEVGESLEQVSMRLEPVGGDLAL
jgi:hypothetical protein